MDQSALTGESLPVTVQARQPVLMGSTIARGEVEATVRFTGTHTFFGKTAVLIQSVRSVGNLQRVLMRVMIILLLASCLLCLIAFIYLLADGEDFTGALEYTITLLVRCVVCRHLVWCTVCIELLLLLLRTLDCHAPHYRLLPSRWPSKLYADCPLLFPCPSRLLMCVMLLPTQVCTTTLAIGSRELAKQGAIVVRLSSVEELAGMNILCSDKTGTLTLNTMVIQVGECFQVWCFCVRFVCIVCLCIVCDRSVCGGVHASSPCATGCVSNIRA